MSSTTRALDKLPGERAAAFALLSVSPRGFDHESDERADKRAVRIDRLTELFESRVHLRPSPEPVMAHAKDVCAASSELTPAMDTVTARADRVELLERVHPPLVTGAHSDLKSLRRRCSNVHF